MANLEKSKEPTPIPLVTNSDETNQKDFTINIQTDNNIKTDNNQNITTTKAEKLEMMNKIFLSNSSFNKQTKEYYLNRFQIILILKKSNIINDYIINKAQADLILTKLKPNQNKYSFLDFINFNLKL